MPNAASAARTTMRMSDSGLELVKAFESCMAAIKSRPGFFKPYKDSAGVLTIGWGGVCPLISKTSLAMEICWRSFVPDVRRHACWHGCECQNRTTRSRGCT